MGMLEQDYLQVRHISFAVATASKTNFYLICTTYTISGVLLSAILQKTLTD